MGWLSRRLSFANVVASLALFVALGGGAYALGTNRFVGRGGAVRMCVQSQNHVPLIVTPGAVCPAGSTAVTVNARGPRGPRGRRGAKGRPGATTSPSAIDAFTDRQDSICAGCRFVFVGATGESGVNWESPDISLGADDATFTLATTGTYLVTVTVGPAGPVQLEVNGARVGPDEQSCSGSGVCAFQRIVSVPSPGTTVDLVNTSGSPEQEKPGSGLTILRLG